MSAHNAKKCFEENINLFADARTQPEKFNLYNGLFGLADEIDKINRQISQLDAKLNNITILLQQR